MLSRKYSPVRTRAHRGDKTPGRLSSVTSGANMRSRAVEPFPSLDFEWRLARFQLAGEMLAAYAPGLVTPVNLWPFKLSASGK